MEVEGYFSAHECVCVVVVVVQFTLDSVQHCIDCCMRIERHVCVRSGVHTFFLPSTRTHSVQPHALQSVSKIELKSPQKRR